MKRTEHVNTMWGISLNLTNSSIFPKCCNIPLVIKLQI